MEHSVEQLSEIAVHCGYKLHVDLGPGLLESVYEALMANALSRHGLQVDRQKPVRIEHDGIILREGFRADIVVGNKLLIELKSTERHMPVHAKQVLTYLRLMPLPLGLLMNFGAPTFKEGCKRIVNNHSDFASSRLRVNQTEKGDPDDKPRGHGAICEDDGH
ncbi:MAG: GxxExxY protein [Pseudomonadota bacterium]